MFEQQIANCRFIGDVTMRIPITVDDVIIDPAEVSSELPYILLQTKFGPYIIRTGLNNSDNSKYMIRST